MVASRLMRLVQLGVHRAATPAEVRWAITINIVATAAMVLSTSFAVFYSFLDFGTLWPVVVTNVIWLGGYAAGMRLNWSGRRRRASWLMLATGWGNLRRSVTATSRSRACRYRDRIMPRRPRRPPWP